jgi:hypothetical protein
MSKRVQSSKKKIHRAAAGAVSHILRPGAVADPANFELWQEQGYHITPVHFYQPIPDTRELRKTYPSPTTAAGIDLRQEFQLQLLQEVFASFAAELNALPVQPSDAGGFYLDNDAFLGIDPHVYYSMIRCFKPATVVEVGSGFSTLLGAQAARRNRTTRYVCIDPWPREFVAGGVPDVEMVRQRVEETDIERFTQLRENDILFVDSSHVVRTGGDVNFMILEVLPRLAGGVVVHFHDIFLPFEYPQKWVLEDHRFWTEQYLLQAYLAENDRAEVLFAVNYMSKMCPEELKAVFPNALWHGGASFWFRKR